MRTKGLVRGIALVIFLLANTCSLAFAAETVSNEELIKELKAMKEVIAKPGERIAQLENQVNQETQENDRGRNVRGSAESSANDQQEKIDNKLKGLKKEDISKRMKSEMSLLESIPGGLNIGAGITFVGQGTQNANNASAATDGEDSRFDGSYSIDVEIEKEFDDYGMAFVHMEAGQGDTVEGELSVFSNVNRDAGETQAHVDITEAWYEQYLFKNQLTITGGKIDATGYIDTNEYANDECTQFLGRIFRNSAVIDWPDDNAFGGRVYITPEQIDFIDIEAVCMDENGNWENLFNKPFVATQLNFMPAKAFNYDEESWAGNYRAYLWYNGALHSKVNNEDETEKGNIGFGLSCDQMLTEVYGVFGRFGWTDPKKNNLEYDWSAGAQMIGRYWKREDDRIAIAVGQAIPGKKYRDVNEFDSAETHLEAYYAFKVNNHLTITPDMQAIWKPNGGGTTTDKESDTILVYGVRGQVDF